MDYIRNLPIIMCSIISIIVGVLNYGTGNNLQDTYRNMIISIVVYYVLGMYIRHTAIKVFEHVKKRKQELKEQEAQAALADSQRRKLNNADEKARNTSESKIDYRVEYDEDFTPLKVSEVLKMTEKNQN
ncbi:MAG: hypothetical protein N2489_06040 [Clostridia bacterium]|nr:hypothetical protein [Clostridia bacterium]